MKLIARKTVAELLDIAPSSVSTLTANGTLHAVYRTPGGRYRYDLDYILQLKERNTMPLETHIDKRKRKR